MTHRRLNTLERGRGTEVLDVVTVGLGGIGSLFLEAANRDPGIEVVALVDSLRGGEFIGDQEVLSDVKELPPGLADVAVVAAGSGFREIAPLLRQLMAVGVDIVSTCEELSYPWFSAPELSDELCAEAVGLRRRILGCGVNPGFVMDALPLMLSSASLEPDTLSVRRYVNLARRRPQLRAKVGVGLAEARWLEESPLRGFGHRGLVESAYLCVLGIGWNPESIDLSRFPIGHDGIVQGIREVVNVSCDGGRRLFLELVFEMEGSDRDSIEISGKPPIMVTFEGGLHGDDATVARMVHTAKEIGSMEFGLRLPVEVPPRTIQRAQIQVTPRQA